MWTLNIWVEFLRSEAYAITLTSTKTPTKFILRREDPCSAILRMIIHGRYWESNRCGTISCTPEDSDDIWSLYNIITPGDQVESLTLRRVIQESSSGANNSSHKVKMWMLVQVEKLDADLKAASLRLNGRNIRENEHVKMGSYHTLDIEPSRKLKITKTEWTSLDLEILDQAANTMNKSEVAAIVCQEGLANFCTVNASGDVRVIDKVEQSIPKKKLGSTSKLDSAVDKFYAATIAKMNEIYDLSRLKALVLAGPGDAREELYKRIIDNAVKSEKKDVLSQKAKFLRLPTNNSQPGALKEILKEPRIAVLLADTKGAQESKLLDQLHKELNAESGLGAYGFSQVQRAVDEGSVKHLLISDGLFRSVELKERKKYSRLVELVKSSGGSVHICTSDSETDKRLMMLTGVAAVLHFPLIL